MNAIESLKQPIAVRGNSWRNAGGAQEGTLAGTQGNPGGDDSGHHRRGHRGTLLGLVDFLLSLIIRRALS